MSQEVITIPLTESSKTEEEACEAIVDEGFVPHAPVAGVIAAYEAGATYAKNALVQEGGIVYRSQVDGNKGNKPNADADFANWAPSPVATIPLQNPAFGGTSYVRG